jgi:hypothetical protein
LQQRRLAFQFVQTQPRDLLALFQVTPLGAQLEQLVQRVALAGRDRFEGLDLGNPPGGGQQVELPAQVVQLPVCRLQVRPVQARDLLRRGRGEGLEPLLENLLGGRGELLPPIDRQIGQAGRLPGDLRLGI